MTVVTLEQAKKLCPEAFGGGDIPTSCDLCGKPWHEAGQSVLAAYGPFAVWVCKPCEKRMEKINVTQTAGPS